MDHPSARPGPFRVMLSSTFRDLTAHRDAVLAATPSYDMLPVAMEYDAARSADDLISASLKKVEQSDAYVGIIGYRYGQIPICGERNPQKLSLTELEFRRAVELKKPICMFLMSPTHLVPSSVPLNIAEASGSAGGTRNVRYRTALGSARETGACLDVAMALGYVES